VKGQQVKSPSSSVFAIRALAANFGAVKEKAVPKEVIWSKPSPGKLKLNIDASFYWM
jgi:hypothetical protein